MKAFFYRAIGEDGLTRSGFLQAEDELKAYEILARGGLYPYRFFVLPPLISQTIKWLLRPKVHPRDAITISRNLSIMLRGGISIVSALESLSQSLEKKVLKRMLSEVLEGIKRGLSLSQAFEVYSDILPSTFLNLIKVGETTGRLDKALMDFADHLERIEGFKATVRRALIYPIFATASALGAVIFWLVYVLPKVTEALKEMGAKLPFVTVLMVNAGKFLREYFWLLPLFPMALVILYGLALNSPKVKARLDRLLLKLPVVKKLSFLRAMVILCEQMRTLLEAGLPIDTVFERTKEAVGNRVIVEALSRVKERILLGERLSESMGKEAVFPPIMVRFVAVGEATGTLAEQFGYLGSSYGQELEDFSARLSKFVEPIVIALIGMFFALVVISLMLPIYDMISRLSL